METPAQWPKIKEILGGALEREPGQRSAYLDSVCASDAALRAEVESLLAAHAEAAGLSASPWTETTVAEVAGEVKTIGPYRLVRTLGVGGMGQVWLAEQTEPVRRTVALKLIRAGMYDSAVVKRFQSERQSLALMNHPAIAKVFDAGTTEQGQPYFVMEYVDGPPITDYCDRKKLGIRERLRLFTEVCEGVQHAHQKAIIHRDLKPSNILITEVDGKPRPRIIDFGLAKATVPQALGETLFTHVGGLLGTPGYMSPEQADPNVQDIDTRTDVYSLGVVLYELLTGFLPFDTDKWKKQRLDEVLRELREADPPRPSTKVSGNRDTSSKLAEARDTEPRQLVSLLRGDLDWITLKALEKDRDRRYGTPSTLASDVERYLKDRPVEARPASVGYRLRKYVRRNRVGVAVTAGLVTLLVAFAVMQAVQLRRTTRERYRADRVTEFMTNMFKVSDPSEARGNTVTAREILDKSAKEIDTGLAKDPELQAQMLSVMSKVYQKLGLYSRAEPLLSRAIAIRSQSLGPDNPETLQLKEEMGLLLHIVGRYADAEKLDREVLAAAEAALGADHRVTLKVQSNLFWTMTSEGRFEQAATLGRATLERQRRILGEEDPDTLVSMRWLAWDLRSGGHLGESEALTRKIVEIRKHVSGPENSETLLAIGDLGWRLIDEGRPAEAEPMLREALAIQLRIFGPDHRNTQSIMNTLAVALQHEHKLDEAEKLYREALERSRRAMGPEYSGTLMEMGNLATVFHDRGEYGEAEKMQREVLAIRQRTLGPEHPDTLLSMFNIADELKGQHRYAESADFSRRTSDIQSRVLGPTHPDTLDSLYSLACALALDGKKNDALNALQTAVERGLPPANNDINIESDRDLRSLRSDPRFAGIVAQAKKRAAAAPETK